MIYGLYLSAQGAEAQALRQSILANNLANAQTTAFKPDIPLFRAFFPAHDREHLPPPPGLEEQTGGVELVATTTDFSQGPLRHTRHPWDVALKGPGFLQVRQADRTLLTRDGRLALNPQQQLVTATKGLPILSVSGEPIVIPAEAQQVEINAQGMVSVINPEGTQLVIGQLAVVEPMPGMVPHKIGMGLYDVAGTRPSQETQLQQGWLEESVVHPVAGMVELIETSRSMEMNFNVLKLQDEMLGQLLGSLPRR
ncbi:MAG: flagellar basal body protein [Planctomycetaceae bacterium]|nr:MAG: flagellar basal body protein [Planctomycetaceae bacterium]